MSVSRFRQFAFDGNDVGGRLGVGQQRAQPIGARLRRLQAALDIDDLGRDVLRLQVAPQFLPELRHRINRRVELVTRDLDRQLRLDLIGCLGEDEAAFRARDPGGRLRCLPD